MQQFPYSPYTESSFVDPFFESYLVEPSKKDHPKLQLEIPHVDSSLHQFLSPAALNSYQDVGLEQIFQPLLDSPTRNVMTPSHFEHNFNFEEMLQGHYMGISQPVFQEQQQIEQKQEEPLDEQLDDEPSEKVSNQEREWSTSYKNEAVVGDGEVEITIKTRREKPTSLVPERLYSSLKYELHITAKGEFVRSLPFLLARISVVDAAKLQPISKNKAVMKGENESALTHPPDGPGDVIKGAIKVQFDSSISYHHDKREVCLEMNFFMNEALDQPILTKRTVPVKMFARKPNKKHNKNVPPSSTSSKRKREADVEEEVQPKIPRTQSSSNFSILDFEKRLDDLVEQSQHLNYEDRQRATGLILSKFGLSPFLFAAPNPYPYPQSQFHI
jgi:hypothetical protein